jgi:uncharacterized protein
VATSRLARIRRALLCTTLTTSGMVVSLDPPSASAAGPVPLTAPNGVIEPGPDVAPAVTSTVPVDGSVGIPTNSNVTVTLSEAVTVTDPWFTLRCAISGDHAGTVTGGPVSYVIDPTVDFAFAEACSVTIDPAAVHDVDGNDPPDIMAAAFTTGFTVQPNPCSLPFTPIPAIQGSGPAAAITGAVTTRGVVVGDYEYPGTGPTGSFLRGFYVQDPTGDGDAATSDAVFVFNGNNNRVAVGDDVRVSGNATEFQDQTQVSASAITTCGTGTVGAADVTLPFSDAAFPERYEGMLVRLPQTLTVTEHFQLGRFGQVVMSSGGRLPQPTNIVAPGAPAAAVQAANDLNRIIIDDASQGQNPDPIIFGRGGSPLSAANTLRGGDTAAGISGVMTYTWAGNAASGNAYRVRPVNALGATIPSFQPSNPRPADPPNVGGTVRVAGMNLLNFFNTFDGLPDTVDNCANGVGGIATDCRGADTQAEFDRQWVKTVAAMTGTAADVIGVIEVENDGYGPTSAIQFLVDRLNAATAPGTYAFVDVDTNTGQVNALGTDAIKVGLVYKPAVVTPIGSTAALNTEAFVNGGDTSPRNRPAVAQAFQVPTTGATFVVSVNHLKSKGSACGSPDAGDGQGNCNAVRVNAANLLTQWLAADPTGTGDPDALILGDLNSYAKEDPITAIEAAGYSDMIEQFNGADAYSFAFDGQWGYLDHALANASLAGQVNDVADWHINADEPSVLDYNTDFKTANLQTALYAPDQFRVADHDPVLIGLTPNAAPTVDAGGPYNANEGGTVPLTATGGDPNGDALSYMWDLDYDGTFETPGQSVTFSAAAIDGPATRDVQVRVIDSGGLTALASATVEIANVAPTISSATFASPAVACGMNNAALTVVFADPGLADTFTAVVDWGDGSAPQTLSAVTSPFSATHTYGRAGTYVASVTVTDDDGGSATTAAPVAVNFTVDGGGVLPPINQDGSSVFREGRTIPIKVRLVDCTGTFPANLAPVVRVSLLSNLSHETWPGDVVATMRYSRLDRQYIYNLDTDDFPDHLSRYQIIITVPSTGQTITAQFRLR